MLKGNWSQKTLPLWLFLWATVIPQVVAAQGPHSQFVGGPWEIQVKMGDSADAPGLIFPFSLTDENNVQPIDQVLPILGTPIQLKLQSYLPDFKWNTDVVQKDGAGTVVKLVLGGNNLNQVHWLTTDDPERSAISSKGVGKVALKKFQNKKIIDELAQKLNQNNTLGVLSVVRTNASQGQDFIIGQGDEITLKESPYKITMLKYFPHYSLDTTTGEVTNASDKPMNPAALIKVDDGKKSYEQWLWAKFPSFSHQNTQRPLTMEFHQFDLEQSESNYILVLAPNTQPSIMFFDGQNTQIKPVAPENKYSFAGNYFFQVEEVSEHSVIVRSWKNNREMLLNPALIATVQENEATKEIVLPLNKPYHYKNNSSSMSFLFKPRSNISK